MESCQVFVLGFIVLTALLCKPTKGLTVDMPPWTYLRDSVTLRCVGPAHTNLTFYKDGAEVNSSHQIQTSDSTVELMILSVSESDQGLYSCGINEETQSTQKRLRVRGTSRRIELTPSSYIIQDQGRVTLRCSVHGFQTYKWIRHISDYLLEILNQFSSSITVSRGGVYSCRGIDLFILTEQSDTVTVWETVSNRAVVKREPDWTEIFCGESLTLRCEIEDEGNTEWTYEWRKTGVMLAPTTREYTINNVSESDSGNYSCRGVRAPYYTTQRSQETRLEALTESKEKSSSVLVMVGAVCVIVLLILLLLFLWRYRKTKDISHNRQSEPGLGSAVPRVSGENSHLYSSLLHGQMCFTVERTALEHSLLTETWSFLQPVGDLCVYENIGESGNIDSNEEADVYENAP